MLGLKPRSAVVSSWIPTAIVAEMISFNNKLRKPNLCPRIGIPAVEPHSSKIGTASEAIRVRRRPWSKFAPGSTGFKAETLVANLPQASGEAREVAATLAPLLPQVVPRAPRDPH